MLEALCCKITVTRYFVLLSNILGKMLSTLSAVVLLLLKNIFTS